MKKLLAFVIATTGFLLNATTFAQGEMLEVDSLLYNIRIGVIKFTVNGEDYNVCTGTSEYCPNKKFITIDPNKPYTFDLYSYPGYDPITPSCKNRTFSVAPNTGLIIQISSRKSGIFCELKY